jgi:hypothetical protein
MRGSALWHVLAFGLAKPQEALTMDPGTLIAALVLGVDIFWWLRK